MTDVIPLGDIVAVLRMADADHYTDDFSTHALASAVWNRLLDGDGKVTDAGRDILTKFGPLYPEETS